MPPKFVAPHGGPGAIDPKAPKSVKKKPATPFAVKPIGAFYVFFAANLLAALYGPIQDCDETFNFWEPTHYMSHGYGLETWEYSPEFAIRSWLYIAFHGIIGNLRRLLPRPSKVAEFYFIRYGLAFICAISQTLLFRVINNTLNPRVAMFFLMSMIFSPGMFHASAAFLPSSFAMYTTMIGMSCFMNWKGGLKTFPGIMSFAVGGIVGWPFSMALCIPFLFEEALLGYLSSKDAFIECVLRFTRGVVGSCTFMLFEVAIDAFFYKIAVVVPWEIVMYNIFSGAGRGPEIFGTEPWDFYFLNLLLNFNIWFVLACLAMPLFIAQKLFSKSAQGSAVNGLRSIVFMTPFYLWLGIFSFQAHKEERFMYPMYPCLTLNAAMALHILLAAFGQTSGLVGYIPARIKLLLVSIVIFGSIDIGVARIYGIYTAYSAPLKIYEPLKTVGNYGDSICFGKEWYRFPTSYHLPNMMHAKFIKSEFDGLLPGEFSEAKLGFWRGAGMTPGGMNDRNEEDMGKYTDLRACNFLVDTYYPGSTASKLEPHYILDTENFEKVKCEPFMDASRTHVIGRTLWLPNLPFIPDKYKRKWGEHCLLKKKK